MPEEREKWERRGKRGGGERAIGKWRRRENTASPQEMSQQLDQKTEQQMSERDRTKRHA